MRQSVPSGDQELIGLLKEHPDRAMPRIFEKYYTEVCRHIFRMIPVKETCEDIAQSIFLELWRKRDTLDIRTSIGAYLHKMALSRTLNYIRDHRKHRHQPEDEISNFNVSDPGPLQQLTVKEMQEIMNETIDGLPTRCRKVFMLSRFEGLSYQQIAEALDISPKTVENQISKALLILREALHKYHGGKHS